MWRVNKFVKIFVWFDMFCSNWCYNTSSPSAHQQLKCNFMYNKKHHHLPHISSSSVTLPIIRRNLVYSYVGQTPKTPKIWSPIGFCAYKAHRQPRELPQHQLKMHHSLSLIIFLNRKVQNTIRNTVFQMGLFYF